MKGRFGQERNCGGETSVGRERTEGEEMAVWFPMKNQCTVRSVHAAQQLGMREEEEPVHCQKCPCVRAAQQLGMKEEDLTAVQTKQEEETYLPSSTTAKLWLF